MYVGCDALPERGTGEFIVDAADELLSMTGGALVTDTSGGVGDNDTGVTGADDTDGKDDVGSDGDEAPEGVLGAVPALTRSGMRRNSSADDRYVSVIVGRVKNMDTERTRPECQ